MDGQVLDEIDALENTDIQTIMLKGEYDRFIDANYYESLAKNKKLSVDIVSFPNAGHAIHLDSPEEFESTVYNFISETIRGNMNRKEEDSKSNLEGVYAN